MKLSKAILDNGSYWTVSKKLVEYLKTKSDGKRAIQAALYYSDIASAMKYHKRNEVYRSVRVIEEHTFLTKPIQVQCRKLLTELNLIRTELRSPNGQTSRVLHFIFDDSCNAVLDKVLNPNKYKNSPKDSVKTIPTTVQKQTDISNNKDKRKKKNIKTMRKSDELDELFIVFWDKYDNKKDRKRCKVYWDELTQEDKELAISRIPFYERYLFQTDYKQLHPSKYIRDRRFEDEYDFENEY